MMPPRAASGNIHDVKNIYKRDRTAQSVIQTFVFMSGKVLAARCIYCSVSQSFQAVPVSMGDQKRNSHETILLAHQV